MNNITIITEFKKLLKQIQFDIDNSSSKQKKTSNMFRLQSIKKVIDVLEKFPTVITNIEQVKHIKDIGKGSISRINEILKTGKLSEIKDDIINKKYIGYIDELVEIFGVGRKTAVELFKKYNVKSIDELKQLSANKTINLPDNITKGLKYHGLLKENIPRLEIDKLSNILFKLLLSIDPQLFGIICGSYRRLQLTSNDIDMLIIHPSYKTKNMTGNTNYLHLFVEKIKENNYLVDSFTSTDVPSKFMGLIRLSNNHPIRRLDIRFIPYESYYYATLYFTGPKNFNKKMRQVAIDNNYILNEYGLYNSNNKMFKATSEKDIFKYLDMEYVPPEKRL